jgi:hypothetical protein
MRQNADTKRLLIPKDVADVSTAWVLVHCSRRRPHLPYVKIVKGVGFRHADVRFSSKESSTVLGGQLVECGRKLLKAWSRERESNS